MGYQLIRGDARGIPLPDQSVDLVFGSPPYRKARLYLEDGRDLGIARDTEDWIAWMLEVTTEALRVCRGAVVWVAAGSTEDRNYHPICEGLMYRWWQMGGHAYRPCYWHRAGIPGNGGDDWFRSDIEMVMCFKRPGALAWSDNTACGHPPKYKEGGQPSHRTVDGARVTTAGRWKRGRRAKGAKIGSEPTWQPGARGIMPEIANPGNLIRTINGGGNIGHDLAHENEAPFPEALAERFILSLCPPGGIVLDNFSGSGTTASVAVRNGRHAIGIDLRQSQCQLGRRRIAEQLLDVERPHRPKPRPDNRVPMPGQRSLFALDA